ncbi:ABC transporter substrate-binding protein [Cupriavidus numazuensis]|uniref:Leucine-, isoleucine-, valine-, threonine-, and alanine-binding protein n=1 Tax=Cupriavidus numazuensis TaxID=221992 RepID=A0ABM8TL99_9BURK|nr:ABC transporter substrate-binding protein [Cupriavidus numazuensis]CAG2153114.1 Leucine-, isoleucine-, valine-, threonine-, and alanine-binding protein [Cupriavidus numazuensis]
MRKKFSLIALFTLIAVLFSGPSLSQSAIEIGATVPLTGPAALTGTQYHNSLRLAEEEINKSGGINGKPLRFIFEDAQSSNPAALNAFIKLVQERKPAFVFLSSYSTQNLAVAPEVLKAKIPVMYGGGADAISAQKNAYMFRIRPEDSAAAQAIARFVKQNLKASAPGIIYIQNDFGQGAAKAAAKKLDGLGVKVAGMEAYGANDKDMSAQLLKLKNSGADTIVVMCLPQDGALILRQAKTLGLKMPIIASSAAFTPTAMQLMSPTDLDNVWGVIDVMLDTNRAAATFVKDYKNKFRIDADGYAAAYYDGAMILAQGLRKVGADPQKLRDYLASVKRYEGAAGTFSFDEAGNGVHEVTVVTFKKGSKDMVFVTKVPAEL